MVLDDVHLTQRWGDVVVLVGKGLGQIVLDHDEGSLVSAERRLTVKECLLEGVDAFVSDAVRFPGEVSRHVEGGSGFDPQKWRKSGVSNAVGTQLSQRLVKLNRKFGYPKASGKIENVAWRPETEDMSGKTTTYTK